MAKKTPDDPVWNSLYGPFLRSGIRDRKTMYESFYSRILAEFAINRFKWEGLPDTVDRRFLELMLYRQALCVFYHDSDFDRYMALRGSGTGKWNMYDNPVTFTVIGNTMVNKTLKAGEECIPIWANSLRVPDFDLVWLYATKLAEIERTIEVNLKAMRKPFLFAVDDTERQTFMNLWRQHEEGEPVIFGTSMLTGQTLTEKVQLFDMKIDKDLVANLQIAKAKMWNEAMTILGINNSNQDKRERLVADEVAANDSQISAARNSCLGARQYAVEQIRKRYPDLSDLSVSWNEDDLPNYQDIPGTVDSLDTLDESGDNA